MIQRGLHYGAPDLHNYCAYSYLVAGLPRPDLRCPNHVEFYVKVPDGRGEDWRKAWASCYEHLPKVVYQMQVAYGGDGFYNGDYLLRAFIPEEGEDGDAGDDGDGVPDRVRDGGPEPEEQVPGA